MEKIPILLDTDPGNDIDDALAIAYLLKQPRCEFLGITTVTGDVAKRAAIAEVVCRSVGRSDIPIVAGRSEVVAYGPGQPQVAQYESIRSKPHRLDYASNAAVDFLRSEIRKRPGEITLLTIAPLSNIGLLIALDPEIPMLVKEIVSMAGAFWGWNHHETNCIVDPAATAMVVNHERPNHTWYGLDVTMQVRERAQVVRQNFIGEPLETILPMAEIWFAGTGDIVYHDPLAAACVFHPDLCEYKRGSVQVDPASGDTTFSDDGGNDHVAHAVDAERFLAHFYEIVKG